MNHLVTGCSRCILYTSVNEEIEVKEDFRWMTLAHIKQLCTYDNVVNMDTRTVLAGLKFSDFITPLDDLSLIHI